MSYGPQPRHKTKIIPVYGPASFAAFLLVACGGSGAPPPPPPPATLTVTIANAVPLDAGQSEPLTANVTGGQPPEGAEVKWTVTCPNGVATCGSMSSQFSPIGAPDTYTAPSGINAPENVTISAAYTPDASRNAQLSLAVNPRLSLVVPAPIVPNAQIGQNFLLDLSQFVQGGSPRLSWSQASGVLPSGITLDVAGARITGTPNGGASTTPLTFTATDSGHPPISVNVSLSLTVAPPPPLTITSVSPPNGTVGHSYGSFVGSCGFHFYDGFALTASGGAGQYLWSWTPAASSSLPPGLNVSNGSVIFCPPRGFVHIPARILGLPTAAGAYQVVVTVSDSESPPQSKSANYTITINP